MKRCPTCQTAYADDSLQFCLQDGTRLVSSTNQDATIAFDTESETVVSPKKVEPIRFDLPSSYQTNQANREPVTQPVVVHEQREAKKSSAAKIVLLSVFGTILLLGLGGLGAWLYFNNKKPQAVAVGVNTSPNTQPNRSPANVNATNNQNVNSANNANLAVSPSPTVQPTLKPEAAKAITNDVKDVMDDWKYSTENRDLDTHVSQYADTVDYYKAGRVGVGRVRADRARAFAAYDTININLDNVKVTPDASGERATVVLDKEWNFEGAEKFSSGKVQQQLTLGKINGRWLITGEKDLKIYYTQN